MNLLVDMARKISDARTRFSQRLRAIRVPRGFKTARAFAEALGIDENRYTRYERGEVEPDLQLLMRICNLLSATPNDLLCDTIGQMPVDYHMPYGLAESPDAGSYQVAAAQGRAPVGAMLHAQTGNGVGNAMADARRAAAWKMAELVAMIEAGVVGVSTDNLTPLDKLRRTGPIFARIEADTFGFLRELPERLQNVSLNSENQRQIDKLIQELIVNSRASLNEDGVNS